MSVGAGQEETCPAGLDSFASGPGSVPGVRDGWEVPVESPNLAPPAFTLGRHQLPVTLLLSVCALGLSWVVWIRVGPEEEAGLGGHPSK